MTMGTDTPLETIINQILTYSIPNLVNDGITICDISIANHPIIYTNTVFEAMTGYSNAEIVGQNCRFLQNDDTSQPELAYIRHALFAKIPCTATLRNYTKSGSMFWNKINLYPITDAPNKQCQYFVAIQKDISYEMNQNEKIRYLCMHDSLTNLYNYLGYYTQTKLTIDEAIKQNNLIGIGVVRVHFLNITDEYTNEFLINQILKDIARSLKEHFNEKDIIAKLNGFQFALTMIVNNTQSQWIKNKLSSIETKTNANLPNNLKFSLTYSFTIESPKADIHIDQVMLKVINTL